MWAYNMDLQTNECCRTIICLCRNVRYRHVHHLPPTAEQTTHAMWKVLTFGNTRYQLFYVTETGQNGMEGRINWDQIGVSLLYLSCLFFVDTTVPDLFYFLLQSVSPFILKLLHSLLIGSSTSASKARQLILFVTKMFKFVTE